MQEVVGSNPIGSIKGRYLLVIGRPLMTVSPAALSAVYLRVIVGLECRAAACTSCGPKSWPGTLPIKRDQRVIAVARNV